jgi:uncharacterized protein (DUF433 family)
MNKTIRKIDAQTILADIKAGMSGSDLMGKHKLSAAGLESLLRRLRESEIIREVIAKDILQEVQAGNLDSKKYDFFFNEASNGGIKRPSDCVISGREIVHDLRSGMTSWHLMLKYNVSPEQLKKAFGIILKERRRIAEKIAEDVRSGMKDSELMEKYQLSKSSLEKIRPTLLKEGLLAPGEIMGLNPPLDNGLSVFHERRQISRRVPLTQVIVCDRNNEGFKGTVKDVTEKGLAVRGLEVGVGELKTLAILGDDLGLLDPFELTAECRWVGSEGFEGQSVAGFLVIAISDQDLQSLQRFVDFLDLGWKAPDDHFEKKD